MPSFAESGNGGGKTREGSEPLRHRRGGRGNRRCYCIRTKLGEIHQHQIGVPVVKRGILPFLGELLHRQRLHILHGPTAGYHAAIVFVDADKSGDRGSDSVPLLPALLRRVCLPIRIRNLVGFGDARSHVGDFLIVRHKGIIANTDPSLGQRDTLLLTANDPPFLLIVPCHCLRRLACHPFATVQNKMIKNTFPLDLKA